MIQQRCTLNFAPYMPKHVYRNTYKYIIQVCIHKHAYEHTYKTYVHQYEYTYLCTYTYLHTQAYIHILAPHSLPLVLLRTLYERFVVIFVNSYLLAQLSDNLDFSIYSGNLTIRHGWGQHIHVRLQKLSDYGGCYVIHGIFYSTAFSDEYDIMC